MYAEVIIVKDNIHDLKFRSRYIDIGLNIAYYRKKMGYTQEDLASIVNISRTHISNIEATGVSKGISLDLIFAIADALNIEPSKLFEHR